MSPKASPSPGVQRPEGRAQAATDAAGAVQVGRDGEVPGGRQPVGLLLDVGRQPEDLVQHDDAGPRPGPDGRYGQVGAQLGGADGARHGHVGHGSSSVRVRARRAGRARPRRRPPTGSCSTRASATCSTPSPDDRLHRLPQGLEPGVQRGAALLDEPVGVEHQDVAGPQLALVVGPLGADAHAEHQVGPRSRAARRRRRAAARAGGDRRRTSAAGARPRSSCTYTHVPDSSGVRWSITRSSRDSVSAGGCCASTAVPRSRLRSSAIRAAACASWPVASPTTTAS